MQDSKCIYGYKAVTVAGLLLTTEVIIAEAAKNETDLKQYREIEGVLASNGLTHLSFLSVAIETVGPRLELAALFDFCRQARRLVLEVIEMIHSEYAKAATNAIEHVKHKVRYRGLNTGGGWIRNPAEVPQKFSARIKSLRLGAARSAEYGGVFDAELYINEMAKLAVDSQTGNCSELSALAFLYLRDNGIRPIEYYGVIRGGWDHAFVVLNRDTNIAVPNFADWSYQAVCCDPLKDRSDDAGFLATWYPKMFPLKTTDLWYRLD